MGNKESNITNPKDSIYNKSEINNQMLTTTNSNWMTKLALSNSNFADNSIFEIAIPGSHHSSIFRC